MIAGVSAGLWKPGLCALLWALLLLPPPVCSAVQKLTPQQRIASSSLVVKGEYLGRQPVPLEEATVYIGVIRVIDTLKGKPMNVVLLHDIPPGHVVTDRLSLQPGMVGLWFITPPVVRNGIELYQVIDPQRFVPADGNAVHYRWSHE